MTEQRDKLHSDPLSTAICVLPDIRVNETHDPEKDRQSQDSRKHRGQAAKEETPEIF